MPLFPDLGAMYLDEQSREMRSRMEAFHSDAHQVNLSFWTEAQMDTRFEAGDSSIWLERYGQLMGNRSKQFNFNRIRRLKNMIGGHQRLNRKSTIVTPRENGDMKTADQFTKVLMWIHQQEDVLDTVSEAFEGALVTGMNLLQVWVDYRSDPINGNIRVDNCSYNSFLIDPYFRKADLSDCNALWKRSFITKLECASLLPERASEIRELPVADNKDGKFQFLPENYNVQQTNDLLIYDEFYYKAYRKQKLLVDTQTGETLEWKHDNQDGLNQFLNLYPQITIIESDVPTTRLAISVQGKVFFDGPNPLGVDQLPFIPVFTYYSPQMPEFNWRLQGIVRGLRDSQYLYNRRKAIELDIMESQINSGWKYKENALVNPDDVLMNGQGKGLAIKFDANMTDVEQIIPAAIAPTTIQLSELLGKEMQEIVGVSDENLGTAVDDKAGILAMIRQRAGLVGLQGIFDNLDRAQKLLGRLMIDIIQSNFTPGKIKRIIEEEPTPQFYNKAFGKYDAVVEDGILTSTQRQQQLATMLYLREAGIPLPNDVFIEAITLQNKSKVLESMQRAEQQQQQMQEMQMKVQMQELQARAELSKARATADTGLGLERLSRIQENKMMAQKQMAESVKEEQLATLNMVKAMKELESIDVEQLERLVSIMATIKQQEQVAKVEGETGGSTGAVVKPTLKSRVSKAITTHKPKTLSVKPKRPAETK